MTQVPPQAPPQGPAGAVADPGKGLSIAGMVLGIVAAALFCLWFISVPCAIVGLILSIMGKGKSKAAGQPTGMATAGLILSVVGLVLGVVYVIFWVVFAATVVSSVNQMKINMSPNSPANQSLRLLQLLF